MPRFVLHRLLAAIPTVILISMLVFGFQHLLPGDPVLAMAGEERDPEVIAHLRATYRFDEPIPVQYLHWAGTLLTGDLGQALRTGLPVGSLIAEKLPVTFQLAVMAPAFAMLIGIPMGILAAVRKGAWLDCEANVVAPSGLSIPNVRLGILPILLVSVQLGWLPASGCRPFAADPLDAIRTMPMPAFVLGTALAATLMRHTRSAMLGVLQSDSMRTARAKGLAERVVIGRHALRNALVPVVTISALLFGELMARAVLTEQVFNIPGFGRLVADAVFTRDDAVVQGIVVVVTVAFILLNLLADVLHVHLDPRLRDAP